MNSPGTVGQGNFIPGMNDQTLTTPLFEASGWADFDGHSWSSFPDDRLAEEFSYINAGTCPDCGNGMVRLGHCMNCPCCGYGSCGE